MPDPAALPPHASAPAEALAALEAGPEGLTSAAAAARLARHGANRLPGRQRPGLARRFAAQFRSLLVQLLAVAALVLGVLGHAVDAGVIAAVILLNAGIGLYLEAKAEGALAAVVALLAPRARVLRDGRRQEVAAESLVPGDVVAVEAGDRVPADLRLLEAQALRAQEAALTGKSLPADKAVPAVAAAAPPGDRHCMLHAGTVVVAGTGLGLVVATGAATEVGRIGVLLGAVTRSETPLLRQIARLGGWIAVAVLGFAVLAFLAGTLVHGQPAGAMLLAAVALAVAAIPEELPALVTVTLAVGVGRMARQQALIRNLAAVETLGSVGVICSDKTGTFTRNELVADRVSIGRHRLVARGTGYGPEGSLTLEDGAPVPAAELLGALLPALVLCNDAELARGAAGWTAVGDPLEAALLALARRAGGDHAAIRAAQPRRGAIPFDAVRRWMAVRQADALLLKGARKRCCRCVPGNGKRRGTAAGGRVLAGGGRGDGALRTPGPRPGPAVRAGAGGAAGAGGGGGRWLHPGRAGRAAGPAAAGGPAGGGGMPGGRDPRGDDHRRPSGDRRRHRRRGRAGTAGAGADRRRTAGRGAAAGRRRGGCLRPGRAGAEAGAGRGPAGGWPKGRPGGGDDRRRGERRPRPGPRRHRHRHGNRRDRCGQGGGADGAGRR